MDPEGRNLILGECKYWQEPVGANVLWKLERKADAVDWNRGSRQLWYVLFSTSGFTDELRQLEAQRKDVLLMDDGGKEEN